MIIGVLGYMIFFAELEFFGQSYKPSQEVSRNISLSRLLVVDPANHHLHLQLGNGVATLFGIFTEENRYDRNPDSLPASSDKTPPSPRS